MSDICSLADKSCVPCQGSVPSLSQQEIEQLLTILKGDWIINRDGHLYKRYLFKDFMEAFDWAHGVALLAEEEKHHPDLRIAWGSCVVEIWTHKINGLSKSDFILAAKIETLAKKTL